MQKSTIVSLSLALFTLAAGLLWDQKDVFLISYWGRPHPEVQLYGSQLISMFCMYLTSNTRWSQLFMDIEQKTPQKKKSVQSHLWLQWVLLFSNIATTNFNITVPISIVTCFFVCSSSLQWYKIGSSDEKLSRMSEWMVRMYYRKKECHAFSRPLPWVGHPVSTPAGCVMQRIFRTHNISSFGCFSLRKFYNMPSGSIATLMLTSLSISTCGIVPLYNKTVLKYTSV